MAAVAVLDEDRPDLLFKKRLMRRVRFLGPEDRRGEKHRCAECPSFYHPSKHITQVPHTNPMESQPFGQSNRPAWYIASMSFSLKARLKTASSSIRPLRLRTVFFS